MTNAEIFAEHHIQPISTVLKRRRLTFVGHCWRSSATARQPISDVLLLQLAGSRTKGSGRRSNFRKLLVVEANCTDESEVATKMDNRDEWRKYVNRIV